MYVYSGEKTKTTFLKNISTYCLLQFYKCQIKLPLLNFSCIFHSSFFLIPFEYISSVLRYAKPFYSFLGGLHLFDKGHFLFLRSTL